MNWLELLGWIGIVLIAIWLSALSAYLMICRAVGWTGRTPPLAGIVVSLFLWWLVIVTAPLSIHWSGL